MASHECSRPDWVETDLNRALLAADEERKRKILSRTLMQTFGSVEEDVGWATVYLCSPAAPLVTGTVLRVDGQHRVLKGNS
jgi:NAD(P)-dependent dehydrogenase (short-subunit alcohol dehydrogenase family)